jgi:nicotinate-nucleotide--dimethylbenzimidazole phosphoribosyltransferase
MCSDNGVVAEGIAAAPQEITLAMTANFIKGITGVSVLAKSSGADVKVYDVGINSDEIIPHVINNKIRKSTNNIKLGAAMNRGEAVRAILIGINAVSAAKNEGYELLGAGEMGIGNTTTTTAILSAVTDLPAKEITGKGAGLTPLSYAEKIAVIDEAVKINAPDKNNPLDLIAKLGGFDIAAMTGVFLGAAYHRLPVVADGYISVAAAFLACMFNEKVKDYLFLSHISEEPGSLHYMNLLNMEASFNLNMRLGEGSGCPLMFDIIKSACAVINDMATFEEALADTSEAYLKGVDIIG